MMWIKDPNILEYIQRYVHLWAKTAVITNDELTNIPELPLIASPSLINLYTCGEILESLDRTE